MKKFHLRLTAKTNEVSFIAWRFYLILALILIAALGLTLRMFDLAVLDRLFLRHEGNKRVLRLVRTPAYRGMILDRNGLPIAVSTKVYSVWINPQEFSASPIALASLDRILHLDVPAVVALIRRYQELNREFAYLKRDISPEVAEKIQALTIPGVYMQESYHRYYPEGETLAQLIGFTNVDDQGQEGMELAYNEWLQGEAGKKWVIKDRLGNVIADVKTEQEQKPGQDLTLSIDKRIQYLAYNELLKGVLDNHARAGTAVILDVKTGEVLAMVNYPSFNPNHRVKKVTANMRNRALTDTFEPASTLKAFSVACALESKKYSPNTLIDTYPGYILRNSKKLVRDESNYGVITVREVLQKSSNVGAAKMILSLPKDQLLNILRRVGFGEITGVGFPGEQSGRLVKYDQGGDVALAILAFGYGISVTPLQLARAYQVIANEGFKLPVSLLRLDKTPEGEEVINRRVAKEMLSMLESVVVSGTGKRAAVPGYRVAGKTGTAKIARPLGYQMHRYNATFVGIAPVSAPKLVVAVVLYDPKGKDYLAAYVASPTFSRIMAGSLRILDIPPDGV